MLELKFVWIMIIDFLPDDRHLSSVHKSSICSEAATRSSSRDVLRFFKRSLPLLWMAFLNNSIVFYDAYCRWVLLLTFTSIQILENTFRLHVLQGHALHSSKLWLKEWLLDQLHKNRKYEQPTLIIKDSFCARSHVTVQYPHTMDKIMVVISSYHKSWSHQRVIESTSPWRHDTYSAGGG